jgi:ketosteroid isomerase-like protein
LAAQSCLLRPESSRAADEQTFAEAVKTFRQATLAGDHAAFDALCAAQLSYGHSTGVIQTKEEFIDAAASGKLKWKTLEFANVRNTVAGPNAISRFTFNGEAEIDDKIMPVSIGALMVWQKQGDTWKLLHDKGSRLRRLGNSIARAEAARLPQWQPSAHSWTRRKDRYRHARSTLVTKSPFIPRALTETRSS